MKTLILASVLFATASHAHTIFKCGYPGETAFSLEANKKTYVYELIGRAKKDSYMATIIGVTDDKLYTLRVEFDQSGSAYTRTKSCKQAKADPIVVECPYAAKIQATYQEVGTDKSQAFHLPRFSLRTGKVHRRYLDKEVLKAEDTYLFAINTSGYNQFRGQGQEISFEATPDECKTDGAMKEAPHKDDDPQLDFWGE